MPTSTLHEAEVESRWEAAPTILLVIGIQVSITIVSLQQGWSLWRLPWWSWLVLAIPEAILRRAARRRLAGLLVRPHVRPPPDGSRSR